VTTDLPPDLEAALAQRYRLRRVLGRGGMATVYLAHDPKHQREVAIKVLRPDLAASLGAERFLKEIQIAARLTHPHILAVHDSGEAGGFLYYVMPHIEGASLRQRLERDKRLTVPEALAIAAPVADALAYAHRMGVMHRDIKPENILFSQGHPIVADFGIAKAVSTAGGANLTRTGFPLGTPGYMSPEQAAGLTDLDERTDVYSLAVVIYEMLVGEIAGRWPTEDAVRAGRFLEASAAHRGRLTEAGTRVEAALVRGMAIRHDQRTPTPTALIEQLLGTEVAPRRRYTSQEIDEIVRRASELEASNPTGGAMTLGGVEALAAEVGIAPEVVRQAAGSMAGVSTPADALRPPGNPWVGSPTTLLLERVVEGELPEVEYAVLVDEIRRVLGQPGQVSQLGRSFAWSTVRGGGQSTRNIELAVSVRGGRTRISLRESLSPLVGAVFGGIGGGVGGGGIGAVIGLTLGAAGLAPIALVAVIPVWFSAVYVVARTVFTSTARRREKELTGLADRLAALTAELVPARPGLPPPGRSLMP